ncbi:MAG: MBL fold metallo-hydrolase [Promethearchaeati archaeon SRVP18_Atabeyarchaeia-1]
MVDIYEIADGVFGLTEYLPENSISVSSFLIAGKAPVLIETGTPYLANGFLRLIGDMVSLESTSHIMITHEHLDHLGGLPEYVSEAYNASVVAHNFLKVQLGFMGVVRGITPVNGGETIPLGSRRMEVIYAPIETTGTVVYLLQPDGILFSGDYFGQLGQKKAAQAAGSPTERLVHDIMVLHEGLGYSKENIKKYLAPLGKKNIKMIAPSHGSLIKDNVDEVIDRVVKTRLDSRGTPAMQKRMDWRC